MPFMCNQPEVVGHPRVHTTQLSTKNSLKFCKATRISISSLKQNTPNKDLLVSQQQHFMVFPKSTKLNMPMHPIVSACGTETYNTAKFITKILQITVARPHPLLKIVQISSTKLKISQ